jgi:hypothetical protein
MLPLFPIAAASVVITPRDPDVVTLLEPLVTSTLPPAAAVD